MGNLLSDDTVKKEYMKLQQRLQKIESKQNELDQKYKSMIYYFEKNKLFENYDVEKEIKKLRDEQERLYTFAQHKFDEIKLQILEFKMLLYDIKNKS